MTAPVPADLAGLWRREVITAPGFRDETTRVLWLQTPTWYADIRVAADRPGPRSPDGFAAYSNGELLQLAKIQGFAGELSAGEGICLWRRDFDRQPPGPIPDEARYSFDGPDVMIEDGIHADYQEIWRRVGGGPYAAFRLEAAAGPGGLLVIAGEHLIEFRARAGAPLTGDSLAALAEARLAAGDRQAAEELLHTRIRYAVRTAAGWTTRLSTHPWLEGRPLWTESALRFDAAGGGFQVAGEDGPAVWNLLDAAVAGEALGRLVVGRPVHEPTS